MQTLTDFLERFGHEKAFERFLDEGEVSKSESGKYTSRITIQKQMSTSQECGLTAHEMGTLAGAPT